MSDDNQTPGVPAPGAPASTGAPNADEIKNLKAEMNRKLENTNAQLAQVLEALKKSTPTPPPQAATKVSVFDDEEAFAANIVAQASSAIKKELSAKEKQQVKYSQVIQPLYNDYPELSDNSGELMTKAKEIFSQLPEDERTDNNMSAMRSAVLEAAQELGLKPKNKRGSSQQDDGFVMGSGGRTRPAGSGREGEVTDASIEFAKLLGRPVDDPKYIERLKIASKRKNWSNYE